MSPVAEKSDAVREPVREARTMRWWSLFVLVPGLVTGVILGSLFGADAFATANWSSGIAWGLSTFVSLGLSFFGSRLSSPTWALGIAVAFFGVVLLGSQIVYYDQERSRVYRYVQDGGDAAHPVEWRRLPPERLYQQWIATMLDEPTAHGWADHLRAHAVAGIANRERASHYEKGKSGYRLVVRKGWEVWNGWFWSTALAGFGCLLGVVGALFWSARDAEEMRLRHFAEERDGVGDELARHGLSASQIRSVLRPGLRRSREPIPATAVATLFPGLEPKLIAEIRDDLEINRQLRTVSGASPSLDEERLERGRRLVGRYFSGRRELLDRPPSWLLLLIAASRLRELDPEERFWDAIKRIYDTLRALGHDDQIQPLERIDLDGLDFERVPVAGIWEPLVSGDSMFYEASSPWGDLERMKPAEIPQAAHVAIIHQYYSTPDRRIFEHWAGIEPAGLVERLGPRLRNALLTYIEMMQSPNGALPASNIPELAGIASAWPYEIAEPILTRAMEAGWRWSVSGLPETVRWRRFLNRYDRSPFGSPRASVRWFEMEKRRERESSTTDE